MSVAVAACLSADEAHSHKSHIIVGGGPDLSRLRTQPIYSQCSRLALHTD
jgi:hypothetical protein